MKKSNLYSCRVSALCAIVIIILHVPISLAISQTSNTFPLKLGKMYHVVFQNTSESHNGMNSHWMEGVITLVAPPEASGWVIANIENGFQGANLRSLKNVALNLNFAVLIEETAADEENIRSIKSNKEGIYNSLINLGANAYQFFIRPITMNGGGHSYEKYSIPYRMVSDDNGNYSATASVNKVLIIGISKINSKNLISVEVDTTGMPVNWKYEGDFK